MSSLLDRSQRPVAFDCRHFLGDRPCTWHKREQAVCNCDHYEPVQQRILIIKLDAMGDVLRTTALLPPLTRAHPGASIAWMTRPEAAPLLQHNPYLDEVIHYGADGLVQLQARRFDRVINLDAGKTSAGLAALADAPRKDGFVLGDRGHVEPTNAAARRWLEMGLFDDLKRRNRRTYQDLMCDILGLEGADHRYVLALTELEHESGRKQLENLGLDPARTIVGLNTGAGGRWPLKQWREDGFIELVDRLDQLGSPQFLLLGGPDQAHRHATIRNAVSADVRVAPTDLSVRIFAALVGACDVLVTGDTLAMHLALALERRVVVLFGPTSAAEIDLYQRGDKILPSMDCLACYKTSCDYAPNCMDLIRVDAVTRSVMRQLTLSSASSRRAA